jgi:hypothetical protein
MQRKPREKKVNKRSRRPAQGDFIFLIIQQVYGVPLRNFGVLQKHNEDLGLGWVALKHVMGPRAVHGPSRNTKLLAQSESIPTQTQLRIILDTKDGPVSLNSEQ